MGDRLQLIPAYGRRVESAEELRTMWADGKDFRMFMAGGFFAYCSIRDFDMLKKDFDVITLRSSNPGSTVVFECPIFTHILAGNTSYI